MNKDNPYYAYVIAGGVELDRQLPADWPHCLTEEDLQELDMQTSEDDVLALLEKHGYTGHEISHHNNNFGMSLADHAAPVEYAKLSAMWRGYIIARQALPLIPDGHVYLGTGFDGACADVEVYITRLGEPCWRYQAHGNFDGEDLHYCTADEDFIQEHLDALRYGTETSDTEPAPKPESDPVAATDLTLHADDGVNYRGYWLTENDINRLMNIVESTHRLEGAGFDVIINEVSVGCMRFTRHQLQTMYREYKRLKREAESGFTVAAGDRVRYLPAHEVYIVASIAAQEYILISTSSGNRWNDKRVIPDNPKAIPFKQFLTNGQNIEKWRKET